jgi:hypothetical protein
MIVDVIFIFAQNHTEASNYRKLDIPPFGFPHGYFLVILHPSLTVICPLKYTGKANVQHILRSHTQTQS